MKLLEWTGEHPFLTVMLLTVIGTIIIETIKAFKK